jgi:hypothetical protein
LKTYELIAVFVNALKKRDGFFELSPWHWRHASNPAIDSQQGEVYRKPTRMPFHNEVMVVQI